MKKYPWLETLENLSLVGSGVGAVASIALNQASYAVAPLSIALALGMLNRDRRDQMNQHETDLALAAFDQRFSQQFQALNQQITNLPTPEMMHQLKKGVVLKNRELADHLYTEVAAIHEQLNQRFTPLERQSLDTADDLHQLQEKYGHLSEGFAQLHAGLAQLPNSTRIEQVEALIDQLNLKVAELYYDFDTLASQTRPNLNLLQEKLNRLDRQFSMLPPPVDASSLKQEMGELVKLIVDMVPRRDMANLTQEVRELQLQYDALLQSLTAIETVEHQQKQLQEQMQQFPKNLDALDAIAIQRQLTELSQRLPSAEEMLKTFKVRTREVIQQELQTIHQGLQALPQLPKSEFIFDLALSQPNAEQSGLTGSQATLEQALASTKQRLILIWPWSPQCCLDQALLRKFTAFLDQKRRLDIGWCHIAKREENRLLSKMKRGWTADGKQQELQETLRMLLSLKQAYPDYFQFKILGTSENFLVSDQSFAVLGITDALKTSTAFSELQLKLRIRDPKVLQTLIQRFDHPALAPDDLAAYWNRAVTRHDLGDKAGAIADYTHLLQVKPRDAIAHNYRGLAYYDAGNLELAIADLSESLQLNPCQVAAYCNRGFIRAEQTDYRGAIQDYSLAIQAQPASAIAYFYRGIAYQKLEYLTEAIADFTEAIALAPDSTAAYYYRGLAWQKAENAAAARADLEIAVERFRASGSKTNAQKAAKQLAKLRSTVMTSSA
ncbi:MAG: hypothetical protein Kow00121_07540 [Elainellaceae cyanobacterium]